jgi:hypothetical protein
MRNGYHYHHQPQQQQHQQGRIPDFKLGGAHLKKLRRAEGGAKILGVFPVKNHYFTPKNHMFSNCEGRRENCWCISCKKSRFYPKKIKKKSNFRGGARRVRPPLDPPLIIIIIIIIKNVNVKEKFNTRRAIRSRKSKNDR